MQVNDLISKGARMLMWSLIISLVGGAVSMAAMAAIMFSSVAAIPATGVTPPVTSQFISSLSSAMAASAVAAAVFGAVMLVLQWIGWSRLRDADRYRYGIGRTGLVLLIVGFVLVMVAEAVMLTAMMPVLASYLSSGMPPYLTSPYGLAGMMGYAVAVGGITIIGSVLAVAGTVMTWIGLWRLDVDHGTGLLRASIIIEIVAIAITSLVVVAQMILLATVVLAFISYILMIVGLHRVSDRAHAIPPQTPPSLVHGS